MAVFFYFPYVYTWTIPHCTIHFSHTHTCFFLSYFPFFFTSIIHYMYSILPSSLSSFPPTFHLPFLFSHTLHDSLPSISPPTHPLSYSPLPPLSSFSSFPSSALPSARHYEQGGFSTLVLESVNIEMREILSRVIRKRRLQSQG